MTAIHITSENFKATKRNIAGVLPNVGSSHLDQALAAAMGFKTYASAQPFLQSGSSHDFPDFIVLNEDAFYRRLSEVGVTIKHKPRFLFQGEHSGLEGILVPTERAAGDKIKYDSKRAIAYRNVVVAAINAGLDRRLFSLKPGDNRWPTSDDPPQGSRRDPYVYEFEFPGGLRALASVSDAGFDELSFHVAICPTSDGKRFVRAWNAGFHAGDAFAVSWLERKVGVYLQTSMDSFRCRRHLIDNLASVEVEPKGFGDRGRVIL